MGRKEAGALSTSALVASGRSLRSGVGFSGLGPTMESRVSPHHRAPTALLGTGDFRRCGSYCFQMSLKGCVSISSS